MASGKEHRSDTRVTLHTVEQAVELLRGANIDLRPSASASPVSAALESFIEAVEYADQIPGQERVPRVCGHLLVHATAKKRAQVLESYIGYLKEQEKDGWLQETTLIRQEWAEEESSFGVVPDELGRIGDVGFIACAATYVTPSDQMQSMLAAWTHRRPFGVGGGQWDKAQAPVLKSIEWHEFGVCFRPGAAEEGGQLLIYDPSYCPSERPADGEPMRQLPDLPRVGGAASSILLEIIKSRRCTIRKIAVAGHKDRQSASRKRTLAWMAQSLEIALGVKECLLEWEEVEKGVACDGWEKYFTGGQRQGST